MENITISNVLFKKKVKFPLLGSVLEVGGYISTDVAFSKCYCFDTELTNGGWGLSWIIAGQIDPDDGQILLNDRELPKKERRKMSQCVGMDVNDYIFLGAKTIKKQIVKGLRITGKKNASSLEEVMQKFRIDKERVVRTIEHVSALRFAASLGIGYAFDKRIYCFPWIWPKALLDFKDLWLKDQVEYLKSRGCLIIIPTSTGTG